jgi:hypothetical protein
VLGGPSAPEFVNYLRNWPWITFNVKHWGLPQLLDPWRHRWWYMWNLLPSSMHSVSIKSSTWVCNIQHKTVSCKSKVGWTLQLADGFNSVSACKIQQCVNFESTVSWKSKVGWTLQLADGFDMIFVFQFDSSLLCLTRQWTQPPGRMYKQIGIAC